MGTDYESSVMEALMKANKALNLIESHERVCNERWRNVEGTLQRMEKMVSGLYSRWWAAHSGAILLLLGIIGWFITKKGI